MSDETRDRSGSPEAGSASDRHQGDPYLKDAGEYDRIVQQLYEEHPHITLSPEYAECVKENLLFFLIRLARYKFVARLLAPDDEVLEIGCGSGLGAIFMAQHCARVTGLEIKAYELEEAARINRRDNVLFIEQDFFEFATDQQFDAVVLLDAIEHMEVEDGRRLVAKTCQHLRRHGMLVVGTPSIHSLPYQSAASRAGHIHCYDQQELIDLVGEFYGRVLPFSMNDELVHTGHPKMAWYYFMLGLGPRGES
jgi:SAM-dependent methyltransferase